MTSTTFLAPIAILLLILTPSQSIDPSWYTTTFTGEGTYYGETTGGNCVLRNPIPSIYSGMTPVAINAPQYDGSTSCGMCVEITGTGEGSGSDPITGTFTAFVSDQCPECAEGDLDLAESGDGRWDISWKAVPCETGTISFYFEGSNNFYLKMQPRNMASPATTVKVNGAEGTRTQDNFFEFSDGTEFQFPVDVEIETVLGCTHSGTVDGFTGDVAVSGLTTEGC